jgi:hypothetical protein
MLPPKFAVAGIAIHEMPLGLRGMLRNVSALSATAESCLVERNDGRLKTDLALDERDDRDDHTPCAS